MHTRTIKRDDNKHITLNIADLYIRIQSERGEVTVYELGNRLIVHCAANAGHNIVNEYDNKIVIS